MFQRSHWFLTQWIGIALVSDLQPIQLLIWLCDLFPFMCCGYWERWSPFFICGNHFVLAPLLVCDRPEPTQEYHVIPDATQCPPTLTLCQNISSLVQFMMIEGVPPKSVFNSLTGIYTLHQNLSVYNVSSFTLEFGIKYWTTDNRGNLLFFKISIRVERSSRQSSSSMLLQDCFFF